MFETLSVVDQELIECFNVLRINEQHGFLNDAASAVCNVVGFFCFCFLFVGRFEPICYNIRLCLTFS